MTKRRKVFLLALFGVLILGVVQLIRSRGEDWETPPPLPSRTSFWDPVESYSENAKYKVRYVMSDEEDEGRKDLKIPRGYNTQFGEALPPFIRVLRVKRESEKTVWAIPIYEPTAKTIQVSNDGKYVIMLRTNISRSKHSHFPLKFYSKKGLTLDYSLDDILPPYPMEGSERPPISTGSHSGTQWFTEPSFSFDMDRDSYYCIYLYYLHDWIVFDMATGGKVKPTKAMRARMIERGRERALHGELENRLFRDSAEETRRHYLTAIRDPVFRLELESLLGDPKLRMEVAHFVPAGKSALKPYLSITSYSERRLAADRLLRWWDGVSTGPLFQFTYDRVRDDHAPTEYQILGTVDGMAKFKPSPAITSSMSLWVFLEPLEIFLEGFFIPPQTFNYAGGRLRHDTERERRTTDHEFVKLRMYGVPPGEYRVHGVWNKEWSERNVWIFYKAPESWPPEFGTGNIISPNTPIITVKPGLNRDSFTIVFRDDAVDEAP